MDKTQVMAELRALAERMRRRSRLGQSFGGSLIAQLTIALASLTVGLASVRAVILLALERQAFLSLGTTLAAIVFGTGASIWSKWKRKRRASRGQRVASELKQAYRIAITESGLAGGTP